MANHVDLWSAASTDAWQDAFDQYPDVIARQGSDRLPELDTWYREQLPRLIRSREPLHGTHDEMVALTKWKMTRGVWRARNLALVTSNDAASVISISEAALASAPHPTAPIKLLSTLTGVGPATASALAAAAYPELYPFFDEIVAAQVPQLPSVAYTLGYYARYAVALRDRAAQLGPSWTPVMIERALWSHAGGKANVHNTQD